MNTYTAEITNINETTERLAAAGIKTNSRMSRHFGEKRHKAGMEFLGRLHDEITLAHPDWRKDDEAPQSTRRVPINKLAELKVEAPTLTDDYLTRLGIPTTLASMSGKAEHGLEVLGGKPGETDVEEPA